MGRIRIKKKDTVLPFRQTVAYRFVLVVGAIALFLIAAFQMIAALARSNTTNFIVAAVIGAGAAFLVVHNLSRMQTARVPKRALQRMRRR